MSLSVQALCPSEGIGSNLPTCSRSDKARVERAGDSHVGCPLDDGASVSEKGQCVRRPLETKEKIIESHLAVRGQPLVHGREVDGTVVLMNLHRIASA